MPNRHEEMLQARDDVEDDEEMLQARDKRSLGDPGEGQEVESKAAKRHRLRSVVLNDLDTNITGHDEIEYSEWEQF